jgi:hypothetical protein
VVLVVVELVLVLVLVVVLVLLLLVVVVVVGGIGETGISIKFVHTPSDITLIIVVLLGTEDEEKPASNDTVLIPVSKGETYPSISEYRLKGPESTPATVNVIKTVLSY